MKENNGRRPNKDPSQDPPREPGQPPIPNPRDKGLGAEDDSETPC